MHDFKRMNFDQRAETCYALADEIFQGAHPQRKIQGSLKMCQCLMAFADSNAGSPAENEAIEKRTSLRSAAAVCARSP